MSLRNTVRAQVRKAFKQIGDLKTTVILTQQQNTAFNFATGESISVAGTPAILHGVFVEKSTKPDSKSVERGKEGSLFFLEEDTALYGGLNSYDVVQFHNADWKIIPPLKVTDFLVEVKVAKMGV